MAQQHFYPASDISSICDTCYSGESTSGCKPDNGSNQNSSICPGSCNTSCNTSQAYCSIGYESISSHADVSSFSGFSASPNDFIHLKWTVEKWNELQNIYKQANQLGVTASQGARLSFTPAESGKPISAAMYNEFHNAAIAFNNEETPAVAINDVIRASHSVALEAGIARGKFNSTVCDVCNASAQRICSYDCSCNYNCSHNCNYNCSYDCSYDCSHDCSHNCNSNAAP